jgi:GAF domain-containing protein/anti-sigma regulatory factor (Ser/Thr protein kinase)
MGRRAKPAKAKVEGKQLPAGNQIQKQLEEALKREAAALGREAEARRCESQALEQQAATAEVLRIISSSSTDTQPVLGAVAERAARLCDARDVAIVRLDGGSLRMVAGTGAFSEMLAPDYNAQDIPATRGSVTGRAITDRMTIHVHDLAEESEAEYPHGRALQKRYGHRTMLATPLLREGLAIGAISICRFEVRPFSESQVALVETFADQAVIAIENVRLFKELEDRNRDLADSLERQTATSEILSVISNSPTDVEPVFTTILAKAASLCGATLAALLLYDGEFLSVAAHQNASPEMAEHFARLRVRPGPESAARLAALERTIVHVRDILTDSRFSPATFPLYQREAARTILAVPMLRETALVGVILLWRREPRPFTDNQVALLQTFAAQAVIAIENVRLFTELQEKNKALTEAHAQVTESLEQQTATAEILRVISSSPTELQPVMDAIAENAGRVCAAADVIIYRVEGESLRLVAARGSIQAPMGTVRPIARDWVTGRAVFDRRTIHVSDLADVNEGEFPRGREIARRFGHRTTLATPMLREGVPIGAILIRRMEVRPFTDKQIELLQTFADQAVIAIENVRLFKELGERNTELAESLRRQTSTGEILSVISQALTDPQPVFDAIARNAAALCDGDGGGVFRRLGDRVARVARAITSERTVDASAPDAWLPGPVPLGQTSVGRVIMTGAVLNVPDTEDQPDQRLRDTARANGFRSVLTVAMLRDTEAIGAISVTRRKPGSFSDAQVQLLQTFAAQAVIAIENVRLFNETKDALEQQTATSEILQAISQSHTDTGPVFEAIADSALRLFRAWSTTVYRVDGEFLYPLAARGGRPGSGAAPRYRQPTKITREYVNGRCIVDRAVVHIADIETEPDAPRLTRETIGPSRGFRAVLCVPLLRDAQPIGTIAVTRADPGRFSDAEIGLLKTFADQAVIAIENVRLFKELQARTADLTQSVEQLTALGEVGRALSSTLDLATVLTTIVTRAVQLSELDGGVVFEYDGDTEEFVHRAATETGGALAEARRATRVRKGEGVVGRTAITLEPAQVPDITVPGAYESRVRENLITSGVRAVLAVPMVYEDRLIGCLVVSRNQPGDFPAEMIELLRTFATQSALAIQNARLFLEIADKSQQLEAASRHKSEFLANMSHELRTPLNAVIGFSEVLLQRMFGELNAKQDEYLKDIYASGQHLLSLINDILDLSKIEAGRMELVPGPFHLPSALDNAVTLVRERAARHGITLQVDVDPGLGDLVGDERKVKQVLLNLLSNAVKFTPEGGRISLKAARRDGTVEIAVTDTGIGIAPEDQAAIFEEFRQVGSDETRKQEGTGLGLTLAKKFVELHGGRIWVESAPGRGSTFTFTLPVA